MRDWTPRVAPLFLRVLLGATFTYAGLQKLISPGFFDPRDPASINSQLAFAARSSPVHTLVAPLVPYASLVGHVVALGEVAVGVAALIGLFTQLAAVGGIALSVSFWLTVNVHVHPYFFVPDIPWAALWAVLWMLGPGELLVADNYVGVRHPQAAPEFSVSRGLPLPPGPSAPRGLPAPHRQPWRQRDSWSQAPSPFDRRQMLTYAAAATGLVAIGLVVLRVRHLWPFTTTDGGYALPAPEISPGLDGQATSGSAPSSNPSQSAQPTGRQIGTVAQLPVGGSLKFTYQGSPAVALHPSPNSYLGLSRVCTHAGCTVDMPSGGSMVCRCHNSVFSAANGAVEQGPAGSPLPRITITAANGNLYAS